MILGFRDKDTEAFANGRRVSRFQEIENSANRRLSDLEAARHVNDLRTNRGNRLEALKGNREGQYSIRINAKWRVCFVWPEGAPGPSDVEIVDYHR
ncbi:MAG: type II toxin-antitoxin system RelE/ParE family toxin [Rhodospirillaceae bacterium]|nr:type II toxin-antitoxin system RelE/ParE family toxin [Rhodospirillaceae bacterium]